MKLSNLISKNNLIFLLPVLSGILLILAYPPYDLEFLVWIVLIPLFYFLGIKSISNKRAFWGGTITGVVFLGLLFTWLLKTAPFDWLGISAGKASWPMYVLLAVLWIIQVGFLSLFLGFFTWAYKKINDLQFSNFLLLIIVPSLWIIIEYLRAWGFGIIWLGKETLFGSHWTFGNLAYTLHDSSTFIQLADIGGIYGISFLIVLVNTIILWLFRLLKDKDRKKNSSQIFIFVLLLILIVSLWHGYGIYKLKSENIGKAIKIALIQTDFASSFKPNPYQREEVYRAVLKLFQEPESIQQNPDFIIAPEGFGLVSLTKNIEIAKYLIKDFWKPGQIFLENQRIIDENGKKKSRLFYYDLDQKNPIAFHDKMLLVPNGEYLPYITKFILAIYSFNADFEEKLFQRGEKNDVAQTEKGVIGAGICSSILSPNLNRQLSQKGAQILMVVSSDAPFHKAKNLLAQNLAMSQLRAIENRRYFAQATNMGYSFLINPNGQMEIKSSDFGNKIIFSDAQLINIKTIYTKFGDWIIILAFLILLIFIILKRLSTEHRMY